MVASDTFLIDFNLNKGKLMNRRTIFLSLLLVLSSITFASLTNAQGGGDTRRRTIAVTYLRDPVKVILAGTTLRPTARGEATVERWRKRNESEIDITIENMIPAYNFGGDFTTFVLWAITPAGQTDNLGEFRLSGATARLKTATPHQAFAMIITAEPHYLVRLPSRVVVLENLTPNSKHVTVQVSDVYFTGDSGRYYTNTEAPALAERDFAKTPMELLQARRAIQIAKLADAERYDPDDFISASNSLSQAEAAFKRGASVHDVGRIARESIIFAVRARDISEERAIAAERRADIARRDADVRRATENASELQEQLTDVTARLKAAEIARTNSDEQLGKALREAAEARVENRYLQNDNEKMREENERLTRELAQAKAQMNTLQAQINSQNAKLDDAASRVETLQKQEQERRLAETRRKDFEALQASLSAIATVKANGNGFIVILPDNFFVTNQTSLALRAKAKFDALGQALAAHPDAVFTIEGHSDNRPTAEAFASGRALAVAEYIAALGVSRTNFKVESRGASMPVSMGKGVAAKAQNRRVQLVFVAP
jgi:outer membrane protein OmpA-like peptidoglycan-associated protein